DKHCLTPHVHHKAEMEIHLRQGKWVDFKDNKKLVEQIFSPDTRYGKLVWPPEEGKQLDNIVALFADGDAPFIGKMDTETYLQNLRRDVMKEFNLSHHDVKIVFWET